MLPGNGLGLQNGLHHAAARDVLRAHPEFLHRRTKGVARFVQFSRFGKRLLLSLFGGLGLSLEVARELLQIREIVILSHFLWI